MYLNSRYVNGHVPSPRLPDVRNSERAVAGPSVVFRTPPDESTATVYFWQDGDRIDRLAEFFGLPRTSWYKILDANPHIEHPMSIVPGTRIHVPRESTKVK